MLNDERIRKIPTNFCSYLFRRISIQNCSIGSDRLIFLGEVVIHCAEHAVWAKVGLVEFNQSVQVLNSKIVRAEIVVDDSQPTMSRRI